MKNDNVYQPNKLSDGRWVVSFGGSMSKLDARAEACRLNDKPAPVSDTLITVQYQDGEYLSGYTVYGKNAELLEKIDLAKYVDGWGYLVSDATVKKFGMAISLNAVTEYTQPGRDIAALDEIKKQDERSEKFAQAKRTNKPVELRHYTADCTDGNEECDLDNVTVYALPNGTTKTTRSHTW